MRDLDFLTRGGEGISNCLGVTLDSSGCYLCHEGEKCFEIKRVSELKYILKM